MNAKSGMPTRPISGRLRRRVWFSLILVGLLLGVGILGWFSLRHRLLDYAWTQAFKRSENLGYQLTSKRLEFSGFATLQIHDLAVTYQQKPLVTVAEMTAKPALLRLLTGEIRLQALHLSVDYACRPYKRGPSVTFVLSSSQPKIPRYRKPPQNPRSTKGFMILPPRYWIAYPLIFKSKTRMYRTGTIP